MRIEGVLLVGGSGEMICLCLVGDGCIVFDELVDLDVVYIYVVVDWCGFLSFFCKEVMLII